MWGKCCRENACATCFLLPLLLLQKPQRIAARMSQGWRFFAPAPGGSGSLAEQAMQRPPNPPPAPSAHELMQGPASWSSGFGPTPDQPPAFAAPVFFPISYVNPLHDSARDGEHGGGFCHSTYSAYVSSGPLSSGAAPAHPTRMALSPHAARRGAGAEDSAADVTQPSRPPSEAGSATDRSTPVEGLSRGQEGQLKRRLEFLREEGAQTALEALQQRVMADASSCRQAQTPPRVPTGLTPLRLPRASPLHAATTSEFIFFQRGIFDADFLSAVCCRER